MTVPLVDIGSLSGPAAERLAVAREIDAACREHGFFVIVGHGLDPALAARLDEQARAFFALDDPTKAEIAMTHGGRAWRGWFPPGAELTSGIPDGKEGIYFGAELGADDPRVRAGVPLHGANQFPSEPTGLRETVLTWIAELTDLGQRVMGGIALGLGLDETFFARRLTADPTILFRIFRYPAVAADANGAGADSSAGGSSAAGSSAGGSSAGGSDLGGWGVGEHTDYGLLTILGQDGTGGLEVRGPDGWVDVPPEPGGLVCNIGDMLDRMTGGRYRSTPHRVRRPRTRDRIASPFFFDPGWDEEVGPLDLPDSPPAEQPERWDGADLRELSGTYGEYLLAKVSKVFPDLGGQVLDAPETPMGDPA